MGSKISLPVSVANGGSGNTTQQPGQVAFYPVVMAPAKWGFINNDVLSGTNPNTGLSYRPLTNYAYDNGSSGVGATVTSNVDGALTIDGGTPAIGDRVALTDPYATVSPSFADGIYTVTNLGDDSSPWVLTRATDHDTVATLGQFWAVSITDGDTWAGATMQVVTITTEDGVRTEPYVVGSTSMGISTSQYSSVCIGQQASAQGFNSSAIGTQTVAVGQNSVAVGNTAVAVGDTDTAVGAYSYARGNYSTSLGFTSYANAIQATAVGSMTNAYAPGMSALAGGAVNNAGDSQSTATIFSGHTTDATPAALGLPFGQAWTFLDWNGRYYTDWSKTLLVKATIVARRTDTPGTDSVWTAQGVLRGDGSATYTWIGGTAPTLTLVAQDAAAASWTAVVDVDNTQPGLTVTVTGAAGETIQWCAEIATVEVSSSTA